MSTMAESFGFSYVLLLILLAGCGAAAFLLRTHRATIIYLTGMGLVYDGERIFADDEMRLWVSGAGVALLILSLGLRTQQTSQADGGHQDTQKLAMRWQLVGASSLVLYALTLPTVTEALGFEGESLTRWVVPWQVLIGITWLVGTAPMMYLDGIRAAHPRLVPPRATDYAVQTGLAVALATALVFPVNYLAAQYDEEWDFSYFRVTDPGSSTEALVRNSEAPVEVLLFYPPGNEVKERLEPYFDKLADAVPDKITYRVVDQAMEPALSEELSVKDNGYVAVRVGEASEKFKVDANLDKSQTRRTLRKFDGEFQKALLKAIKDKRVAYLLTGHNEASPKDENPFFKLGEFQKFLKAQNYEVKDFSVDNGSTEVVPEDAAMLVIAAPEKELFPEEVATISRYVDGGGSLLLYLDPERDPLTDLLAHLGLAATAHPLANAKQYARTTGGLMDRGNLITNRFGSHATVTTLSKFSTKAHVAMISALGLSESGTSALPGDPKYTPLIRSMDGTWEDADNDYEQGPDEKGQVSVLAMAIEGPEATPYRAVVIGDVSVASDITMRRMQGNAQFALDSTRWLIGEEELAGDINNEEDVMIQHTRQDDAIWFYSVIFGAPLFVMLFGAIALARRNR